MATRRSKKQPREFVLDCSVTLAWYFQDEASAYAKSVRSSLGLARAIVPALWRLEVPNVLVLAERRRRSTEAGAKKWLDFLGKLPIRIDDETAARAWAGILPCARTYGLSAYDASYL